MKLRTGKILILSMSLVVVILVIFFIASRMHTISRLLHLAFPPTDLYIPIVLDESFRADINKSTSYDIACGYLDIYEVGILTERKVLPSGLYSNSNETFSFKGKFKIRIQNNSKIIREIIVSEPIAMWFFKENDNYISHFALVTFPMPFYCEKLRLEITVLSPDQSLQLLASPKLYIRVSPIP